MKAIIEEKLIISLDTDDISDIDFSDLKSFSINHLIENNNLIILPQKISLSEINMNSFFSTWLIYDCDISYGYLGGAGCEFSIYIKQKDKQ